MSKNSDYYDNEEYLELINKFEGLRNGQPNSYFEEEEFEKLIDHLDDREKYKKALEIAVVATEQYPYSATLLIQKANLLIILNRHNQALATLQQAAVIDASDTSIHVLKVEALLSLGRDAEAESVYKEAINLVEGEERLDLLFEMADLYDEFEEFEKVFDCLVLILDIEPENEEALFKICFWTDLTGRNEESIRLHQKIIDDYPFNEIAWFNLGAAYQGLRLHEKAIDAYLYAVAINEKFEYAYRNLGDAYLRLRKYKLATEALETVIELGEPEMVVFEAIGHCYVKLNQFSKARENYRKGISLNPEDSQLYYKVALSYMAEENWASAVKSLEVSLKLQPDQADYQIALAQCLVELNQFDRAIENFSFVLKSRPKNLNGWSLFLKCLYNAGMSEEGVQYVELALKQTNGKTMFQYYKALFLLSTGNMKAALLALENAMSENPKLIKKFIELEPQLLKYPQIIQLIARFKKKKSS